MPQYTLRDGESLYVHHFGFGSEPVILLHGIGMDGSSWMPFAAPMLKDKKFYIPDMRGWGKSRHCHISKDYYYGQVADDIHDIIEQIGAPKVIMAGISMGASIGLEYLKRHGGERISRYMNIDHPAHLRQDLNPQIAPEYLISTGNAMMEEARYFDPTTPFHKLPKRYQKKHTQLIYGILKSSLKFSWQKSAIMSIEYNPMIRNVLMRATSQGCWYATLKALESASSGDFDTREALSTLTCPILNIVGTHDTLFPLDELVHVSELAPSSQLVRFDNSGHLLMVTESPKFLRVFKEFIDCDDSMDISFAENTV